MNITAAAGIVKNINQGSAAHAQFPSFASGPQNTSERKAPKTYGETANKGARAKIMNPIFALQILDCFFTSLVFHLIDNYESYSY